jgi:hypothetical protein
MSASTLASVLVELPAAQMRVRPVKYLELIILVYGGNVNSGRCQPPDVLVTWPGIDGVHGLLAQF